MTTILEALRSIVGTADFYIEGSGYSGTWNYGAMIEYFVACCILLVVISSVFKLILKIFK